MVFDKNYCPHCSERISNNYHWTNVFHKEHPRPIDKHKILYKSCEWCEGSIIYYNDEYEEEFPHVGIKPTNIELPSLATLIFPRLERGKQLSKEIPEAYINEYKALLI